ncbi:MAG: HAMP domain-containing protein [Acidobacteria bacterium]|nr:HAMP domain-containing protein [Acidobacteriota bacterium]
MALTLRQPPAPLRPVAPPPRRGSTPPRRVPFRDNTRLILAGIVVLVALLAGLLALAGRSATLAPDFLTEVVLYALSATNLTILVALVFVLARNVIKLVVERRRGLPFAHFRAKLVAVLLGMTLIPAVLVLLVGSELIRTSVQSWFNAPMEEILSSANAIAGDYYQERQRFVSAQAQRLARALGGLDLAAADPSTLRGLLAPDVQQERLSLIEVYVVAPGDGAPSGLVRAVDATAAGLPPAATGASAGALAERTWVENGEVPVIEPIAGGGELIRSAAPIPSASGGPAQGVVVASDYLTGQFGARARRMTEAYEGYQQLRFFRQPLTGVYLSFFLMLTLMILVAATWMGLYLAKRITRPVQMLAAAAKEIGAGHLEYRVEPETTDEFGSLIEAFNRMAGDLAASRRRLERSAVELERKHHDVEGRRRYVATILERIATGVISVDAAGRIGTMNAAAARLLGLDARVSGLPASSVFGSAEMRPLAALIDHAARSRADLPPQDVSIARDGRELHLAVMATPLSRDEGVADGMVLVFDDVTPLIRAQKVAAWREVARRLAHEIKNPLTPIQLCAERLRRHFASAPPPTRALVDECTTTIVGEVESLKGLVDEFSQFARMPAPRAVQTDVHALLTDVLGLYRGLFAGVELRPRFAEALPTAVADPEQIRRVMINLIDNAIEAMDQRGIIDVETQHVPADNLIRVVVADNGPGIPPAERDKLFLPYYSTKQRGSGLGLAIVRRIVAEHGGSIEVTDNVPRGTRFAIELPC